MEAATAEKFEAYADLIQEDRRFFIEEHLWIKTKEQSVIPLKLNEGQDKLFKYVEAQESAGKPVRGIILKARRIGFSTAIQSVFFHRGATHPFVNGLTVAHDLDATEEMFQMDQLFLTKLDQRVRPMTRYSNRKEIVFENPDPASRPEKPGLLSQLRVATAGDVNLGRSKTVHMLHRSELAFWDKAEQASLSVLQTVPDEPGTMIIDESTANGVGNYFHKRWTAAKAGQIDAFALFMPWFEHKAYKRALEIPPQMFGDTLSEEEAKLRGAYKLTLEQVNWRRWAIANLCDQQVDKFRQEYPSNDVECFLLSGRPRFNRELLAAYLLKCTEPKVRGYLKPEGSRFRLEENLAGFVKIWKPPLPGRHYVIGADVAEGVKDGAFSSAHVLDKATAEEVATWHGHIEPSLFGDELNMIGRSYNEALLGVESNNHGHATLARLKQLNYPRLYWHKSVDTRTRRPTQKLGWPTDVKTRPEMIDDLAALLSDVICHDKDTIDELMTYVVGDNGESGPEEGCFSDRVISKAIAAQMRKRGGLGGILPSLEKEKVIRDL